MAKRKFKHGAELREFWRVIKARHRAKKRAMGLVWDEKQHVWRPRKREYHRRVKAQAQGSKNP